MLRLVLLLLVTPAYAADLTVFGMKLGEPIPYGECEKSGPRQTSDYLRYREIARVPCVKFTDTGRPIGVMYPPFEGPSIASGTIGVRVVDGRLVMVRFSTLGAPVQDSVLDVLTKKYGQPTVMSRVPVQNRMGSSYGAISAQWEQPDVAVEFFGMMTTLDEGYVTIATPEAMKAKNATRKEVRPL